MTHKNQLLTVIALVGSALLSAPIIQAQPAAQQPRNQGNRPPGPGGPNMMNPMNQRTDFRNLTMEQRRELQGRVTRLTREITLRSMLENAGITEKATQDTVLAFSDAQEDAVQRLREKSRDLQMSLYDNATPPAQLIALQNDYAAAAEDEVTRREKALALLDEKIGYCKQPRLKAALIILGLMGDTAALANNNSNNMGGPGMGGPGGMMGGPGGFGGPGGGGFGGGFGGPGGQGGPGGRGGGNQPGNAPGNGRGGQPRQ